MKKKRLVKIVTPIAVLLIALMIGLNILGLGIFGATVDVPDISEIPADTLQQIKKDFLKEYGYNVSEEGLYISEYCGTYNGCVAVMISHKEFMYTEAIGHEIIGGVGFLYSNSQRIIIWKDGQIYQISEAYDAGLLNSAQITKIRDIHNKSDLTVNLEQELIN